MIFAFMRVPTRTKNRLSEDRERERERTTFNVPLAKPILNDVCGGRLKMRRDKCSRADVVNLIFSKAKGGSGGSQVVFKCLVVLDRSHRFRSGWGRPGGKLYWRACDGNLGLTSCAVAATISFWVGQSWVEVILLE